MRAIFPNAVLVALAGCSNAGEDEKSDGQTIREMLEVNDPMVCAHEEVQNGALALLNQSYTRYLEEGGDRLAFEAVSATGIDKDIHQIDCSANVRMAASHVEFNEVRQIAYKVRPALDDVSGYIVESERNSELAYPLSSVVRTYDQLQARRRQEEGPRNDAAAYGEKDFCDDALEDCEVYETPEKAPSYEYYSRKMVEEEQRRNQSLGEEPSVDDEPMADEEAEPDL